MKQKWTKKRNLPEYSILFQNIFDDFVRMYIFSKIITSLKMLASDFIKIDSTHSVEWLTLNQSTYNLDFAMLLTVLLHLLNQFDYPLDY